MNVLPSRLFSLLLLASLALAIPEESFQWHTSTDSNALCNDYTRAGFFVSRNTDSDKWVIFLESGNLCYSNETCNRRYFNSQTRSNYNALTPVSAPEFPPFGRFDPSAAWAGTILNNQDPESVINPLMTSLNCFQNYSFYFPNGFAVNGTDFLDRDPQMNRLFPNHSHVIIPYCSSDLWLGEETNNHPECNCFNHNCFNFDPLSDNLQFTFRGKTIFQAVIRQLMDNFGLGSASEVVLAGSSAGGVGVVNHAQWVESQLPAGVDLRVIADSAWFINFQDLIFNIFDGTVNAAQSRAQRDNNLRLLGVLVSHPACSDSSFGYPCCLSLHCMLTNTNATGDTRYFPNSVPIFVISSIYDVFLLAPPTAQLFAESRARAAMAPRSFGTTEADNADNDVGVDFGFNFLRLLGEYGGAINTTIIDAVNQFPGLGFYVPQCVQHIYLATSTLWGVTNASVFGDSGIDVDLGTFANFNHRVASGRWSTNQIANDSFGIQYTIQDALFDWYTLANTSSNTPYQFRADCQGPYCYPPQPNISQFSMCPDAIELLEAGDDTWPTWSKIVIAVVIMVLSILALFMKVLFVIWLFRLERKQDRFLDSLDKEREANEAILMFPDCEEEDAISVSCLDIHYSVRYRAKKAVKDEKKDQTAPIVLNDIAESSSSEEDEFDEFGASRTSRLFSFGTAGSPRRTKRTLQRRASHFILPEIARDLTRKKSSQADQRRQRWSKGRVSPQTARKKSLKQTESQLTSDSLMEPMVDAPEQKGVFGYRKKEILKGISVYFNPGEMIGVMGPSGCGKTTFLDIMTGRRKTGTFSGEIYVNGIPMDEIRDWYIANTGYVLQLATPYYEELTVRENITLSAQIKLPRSFSLREKFERVEQVMAVTGLLKLADTVVGGATGQGLSGGQKRRLSVALQLLKLPSVIFLDEPTSGLDATASFELLSHLNKLADSNRTVILTIHQPRLEIFHMFSRLVLLSDGRVAYHGAPERAYEVFVNALTSRYLEQGLVIPELEDHNPADVIMDMLGNQKMRQIITESYHQSDEPQMVRGAITRARWREYSVSQKSLDSLSGNISYALFGAKKVARTQPDLFTRMATLEARGAKRTFNFFLPFMYFAFGFVLGTVYLQQTRPLLIISGVCVFSVAAGLFMFPAMYPYYQRALQVYTYERADGVGRSVDLVLQGFIRFSSISLLPAILSATIVYFMLINARSYDPLAYLQVVLVNVALSQCWITLLIALICAIPDSAFRVSSGISSVAGFTSGFFLPVTQLGWWYRWLVYINPNYYAVSSVAVFVLSDFQTDCAGSELTCAFDSGSSILRQFDFDRVNPYLHLTIIFSFTIFYLFLAVFFNWARHTSIASKFKRLKALIGRKSSDMLSKEFDKNPEEFQQRFSIDRSLEDSSESSLTNLEETRLTEDSLIPTDPLAPIQEDESSSPVTPHTKAVHNWKSMANRGLTQLEEEPEPEIESSANSTSSGWAKLKQVRIKDDRPERPDFIPLKSETAKSAYLSEGDSHHVWRPKKAPHLADLVSDLVKRQKSRQVSEPNVIPMTPVGPKAAITPGALAVGKGNLKNRQKTVFNRVQATQELLRETTDELLKDDPGVESPETPPHMSLLEVSKKITANIRKQKSGDEAEDFSSVVRKFLTKARSDDQGDEPENVPLESGAKNASGLRRRTSRRGSKFGAVPLKTWKNIAREEYKNNPAYSRAMSEYPLKILPEEPEEPKGMSRSTSANLSPQDSSTFKVSFVDAGASERPQSPFDVAFSQATGSPVHQPLVKKDSHGVMKPSKMAQIKGAIGRRGSAGLPRQNPVDVEASITSLAQSAIVEENDGVLILSEPPKGNDSKHGDESIA